MDINEAMENQEVIETAEEIVQAGSGNVFKVAAGIGLVVLTGVIVYKYVRPVVAAKMKAAQKPAETVPLTVVEPSAEASSEESSEETDK